jgi:hypothetical protein
MWTPLKPSDDSKDSYGLGWGVREEDGMKLFGNDGGQQGTSTAFVFAQSQHAGVVVLTNMEDIGATDLALEIIEILVSAATTQGRDRSLKDASAPRGSVPRVIRMSF